MSLRKLTSLNLLMFLFCFIHRADGQITFHYNQDSQKLDLRCDVGSLNLTYLSHLDSLEISRLVNGEWQVLASLSPHCAPNGPVSHLQDGEVSGQISSAGSPSIFLHIHWGNVQPNLDGNYKCEAYGLASDFIPASTKQEMKLQVQNPPLHFSTMPNTISIVLSSRLDISCSVRDSKAVNMSTLVSLTVFKIHEDVEQILADIKSGHDVSMKPGTDSDFVNGSLACNEGFISMGWKIPGMDQAGVYICEATGINANGDTVFLSRRTNVTWQEPSRQALVSRLMEMSRTKADLENQVAEMDDTKLDSENRLVKMKKTKSDLEKCLVEIKKTKADSKNRLVKMTQIKTGLENCIVEMNETKVDLENRLVDMKQSKADMENRLEELNQTKSDLNKCLVKAEKLARDATEEVARLSHTNVCARSCEDLSLPVGQHVVTLFRNSNEPLSVVCDVRSPNVTWTIFQKRFDGSVDFYRNFSQYENGFGSVNGEHWLGLKHIKRLLDASRNNHELRVDMVKTSDGTRHTRIYPTFSIGPGDSYTLTIAGYSDRGFGMSENSGFAFCAYDHGYYRNRAVRGWYSSGWWHNARTDVNLNGVWGVSGNLSSIFWWEIGQSFSATLSATEMKFRSRN